MANPPDRIESLKDMLWYLRHDDSSLFVNYEGRYVSLHDLDPEDWATVVADFIENNKLPARAVTREEADARIAEIEAQGGTTTTIQA